MFPGRLYLLPEAQNLSELTRAGRSDTVFVTSRARANRSSHRRCFLETPREDLVAWQFLQTNRPCGWMLLHYLLPWMAASVQTAGGSLNVVLSASLEYNLQAPQQDCADTCLLEPRFLAQAAPARSARIQDSAAAETCPRFPRRTARLAACGPVA